MTVPEKSAGPLSGIRVLELCHVVAGPYASMYLAMLGAEVIKIENPKTNGDLARQTGPYVDGQSVRFCALNHNKQSMTLDLSKAEGKALFLQLVQTADVVMDNFRPGVLDRLGVGYEAMKQVNPRIVCGNISGFGSYGPYRDLPAFDIIAQALSGVMYLNGEENTPPMKVGTSIADVLAGMHLIIGILSALHRVQQTGEGCFVETALVDGLVSAMTMEHVGYFFEQQVPRRIGNDYRTWCPAGAFEAADGWFALATGHSKDFRAIARCMGRDDWAEDDSLETHSARVARRAEINEAVTNWSRQHTVAEVCRILRAEDVPCAPIHQMPAVASDPHIAGAREMFPQYEQPGVGTLTATNIPLRFRGTETAAPSPAPLLGQDTRALLRQLLSLSEQELEQLTEAGVIR